ncbi:MAG: FtsK/SpoIIIE domain-containing protein, partial [Gemmataceae bacterium]|nr:FtsK/SpoIIIE domain-containing protein [Gemmataceae bacterium]
MSHASLLEQQRHILRELTGLVTERARLEPEIEATFQQRTAAAEREYQQITQRLAGRHEAERDAAETEYHQTRRRVLQKFDADQATAQKQREDALHQLEERYRADTQKAERQHQETRWQIDTIYEARKTEIDKVVQRSKDEQEQIKHLLEAVQANHRQAQAQLLAWGRARIAARVEKIAWDEPPDENPLQQLEECAEAIEERLEELKDLRAPRWARPSRLLGLAVGLWLVAASPAVWVLIARPTGGLSWKHWLAAGTATALGLVLIIGTSLTALAKAQLRRHYRPICRAWADARVFARRGRERVTARLQQAFEDKVQAKKRRAADRQQADEKARALQADLKQRYHVDRAATEEKFARLLLAQQEERDRDLRQAEEKYQRTLAEVEQRFQDDSRTVQQKYERFLHETRSRYERDRQGLVQRWTEGTSRLRETLARLRAEVDRLFPQWHDPAWNSWKPPVVSPQVLRIGELAVRGHDLVDAPAIDEHSPLGPVPAFAMPALLDFPRQASLLFKAREVGRAEAVAALQMVMFRLLTSLPPGRARLTIIDPVGRGENFAAFMHLADHLEALVSSKIWTEHAHIDQRLADLTAHMENVIQKYLRNQYQTIEEYNAQAGEVAEPYRFLVVADFPVNFSAEAARRLISIASSGARCGVFTLVSVDARQPLPEGCQLQDLEACSSNFVWKDGNFRWKDETFGRFPLRLDPPPEPEFATRILHVVGAEAKRASRVEVSFDFLAPKEDEWWTSDSRAGIYVPLGRAGATKRQALSLGQGTSQHVLIAGKTGSGKSTLLHVLITNLSLLYSPDEVELYLIDFKKGVEFKQYASLELPHARVVAIESEREFGLSVLQRLDAELKIRGERFRQLGVQNIQDFRDAGGGRCPRILLIVD